MYEDELEELDIEIEDNPDYENYLLHYGTKRHSGRYPYGSGQKYEDAKTFQNALKLMSSEGKSDADIAEILGLKSSSEVRALRTIARDEARRDLIAKVENLRNDKQWSTRAIAKDLGISDSTVRELLKPSAKEKADRLKALADTLRAATDEKGFIDVGVGTERHLGISETRLKVGLRVLQDEGYRVHNVQIPQLGTTQKTLTRVLAPPGTEYVDIVKNLGAIQPLQAYTRDDGKTFQTIQEPLSLSSKRLKINYAEDGGDKADGVIYVRPGMKDLSLGKSSYAQVRIAVDGTHFIKGMAIYKDDLPEGADIVFNTNKSDTGNKLDALKPVKDSKTNPFGTMVDQIGVTQADGTKKLTSVMNLVNEEGDWENWKGSIASQVLSKQSPVLAKKQLDATYNQALENLKEIKSLTNPAVKERLLESFSDDMDASAVHLKAAALPRQRTQVILPVPSMKDTEIYAPNFNNGERVALIRYPHGGIFEIPELTVNNSQKDARSLLGTATDAVGINAKVAQQLSGADFDGDTVLVIPQGSSGTLKTKKPIQDLIEFEPSKYKLPDDVPRVSEKTKNIEMGKISNLITDMTIKKATDDEIVRAVKHSMVVIDSAKHHYDYKRSAVENGITALMAKYQRGPQGGADTVVSNSGESANIKIPKRKLARSKEGGPINPITGEKNYVPTNEFYIDKKTGKKVFVTEEVPKLSVNNADIYNRSGLPIENIYANHSNRMKALANEARKEMLAIEYIKDNSTAKAVYANEVKSLDAKLDLALRNAPRERHAQVIAGAHVKSVVDSNPGMAKEEIKKLKGMALTDARSRANAGKTLVDITPEEWDAIQAGAVTKTKLQTILRNADLDQVKKLATPKSQLLMTPSKIAKAKALSDRYTQAEIASLLGVSLTTLKRSL